MLDATFRFPPKLSLWFGEAIRGREKVSDDPTATTFFCDMRRYKDLTNQRFGRLVAVRFVGVNENNCAEWKMRCDCGTEFVALSGNILAGRIKSCGCLRRDMLLGKPSRNKK